MLLLESGGILYIIWPTAADDLWEFCSDMGQIKKQLEQLQPLRCILAVSRYSEHFSEIQQLKKEVLKCLEYGRNADHMGVLTYQDLPVEYAKNDFFDITDALTETIRQLRAGNKKKMMEEVQKIIREADTNTDEYFDNVMELIGANVFLFLSGLKSQSHLSSRFISSQTGK